MLLDLLRRDLAIHRRVLISACTLPFLLMVSLAFTPPSAGDGAAVFTLILGLALLALLPLSLQFRENKLGTLGDLLALPLERRDLVRLRFSEGFLASVLFVPFHMGTWALVRHPSGASIGSILGSPLLLWMLVVFLAYPLPFTLRWGGKGLAAAFALLFCATFGFMFAMVYGYSRTQPSWLVRTMDAIGTTLGRWHQAGHGLGAALLDYGVPLLILAVFYAISVRAAERLEV